MVTPKFPAVPAENWRTVKPVAAGVPDLPPFRPRQEITSPLFWDGVLGPTDRDVVGLDADVTFAAVPSVTLLVAVPE